MDQCIGRLNDFKCSLYCCMYILTKIMHMCLYEIFLMATYAYIGFVIDITDQPLSLLKSLWQYVQRMYDILLNLPYNS